MPLDMNDCKKILQIAFTFSAIWILSTMVNQRGVSTTLKSMEEVTAYIQPSLKVYAPNDILCIFDIDMTLLQPKHPAAYAPNVRKHLAIYHDIQRRYPTMDTSLPFLYNFLLPQRLVDEGIYPLLQVVRSRGIKVIALTATLTGDFEGRSVEDLRYQSLKEKKLSFDDSFAESYLVFNNLPMYRGNYPTFYKGILFSNSEKGTTNKGTVLCAFLKKLQLHPKCIVFVDDRAQNLTDAYDALKQDFPQAQLLGIEYVGAENYCPEEISAEDFKAFWSNCFEKACHLPYADTQATLSLNEKL